MGSQDILKQYNAVKNQYDAVDYDEILKAQLEKDAVNLKADINTFSSGYDSQINNTQAVYDKKIADEKIAYDSEYQKNAVQKLINEKKIAETNANLGLTDSGLNRTQQTAAQLSYANQKGKIDLARQSALDNLTLAMTDAITSLQNEKASGIRDIENKWKSYSEKQAQNTYNTQLSLYAGQLSDWGDRYVDAVKAEADAAAEVQKAQISASVENSNNASVQKIYWFRGVADNGNYLYYNTDTGKNEEVPAYMNPYTSNDNRITYRAEYNDKDIGFFQLADGTTGYQPRGLKSEGGKFSRLEVGGKPVQFDLYGNGKYNSIWYSPSGHYWIWDDLSNSYKNMDSQVTEYLKQVV